MLCMSALVVSCNEAMEDIEPSQYGSDNPTVPAPIAFDVKMKESNTFKAGDTVKFILEGNANIVNFYSGTTGNDYAFRDKERLYDVMARLSFESNKTPVGSGNVDCAELLYATDFNGTYTYENIKNATWKPITSRFLLQNELQATATTFAASGNGDVSDLFSGGKPVYFAWLCKTNAGTNRTQFRVQNFKLEGIVAGNSSLSGDLYSQLQFGFQWVLNSAAAAQASNLPTVSSTLLTWSGIFNNLTGPYKDGYAISKPIVLPQFNAGKDMPTVIITKQKENVFEYKYIYKDAGNYEVVFVASSTTSSKQPEILKKVNITISR
jgi:hypothetical protein